MLFYMRIIIGVFLSETTCPLSPEAWHRAAAINSNSSPNSSQLSLFCTFYFSFLCKTCPIKSKRFNLGMLAHVDLISLFNIKTQSNQAHLLKKDNFNFTLLL